MECYKPEGPLVASYTFKAGMRAKRLSWIQIVSGITSVIVQAIALGINGRYQMAMQSGDNKKHAFYSLEEFDVVGTGIWSGLLLVICGILGHYAAKGNNYKKIVGHLYMNIFLLLCLPCALASTSLMLKSLLTCFDGNWLQMSLSSDIFYGNQYETNASSITVPTTTVELLFLGDRRSLGCQTQFFRTWLVTECILTATAALNIGVACALLIINCKALNQHLCFYCIFSQASKELAHEQTIYTAETPCFINRAISLAYPAPATHSEPITYHTQPIDSPEYNSLQCFTAFYNSLERKELHSCSSKQMAAPLVYRAQQMDDPSAYIAHLMEEPPRNRPQQMEEPPVYRAQQMDGPPAYIAHLIEEPPRNRPQRMEEPPLYRAQQMDGPPAYIAHLIEEPPRNRPQQMEEPPLYRAQQMDGPPAYIAHLTEEPPRYRPQQMEEPPVYTAQQMDGPPACIAHLMEEPPRYRPQQMEEPLGYSSFINTPMNWL